MLADFKFISGDTKSMTISIKSQITGKENKMTLPISLGTFRNCWEDYDNGALVQNAFPMLSKEQREFLMTGMTQEEWDATFPDEEDEEDALED